MTGMHSAGQQPGRSTSRRRWLLPVVIVVAIAVLIGGLFVASALSSAAGDPVAQPDETPTQEPSSPATAPATPTPTETTTGVTQPTDCYEIYGQAFLDTTGTEVLNDPSVAGSDISRYRPIEEIRESLPGIECHWGLATEGGVANAVNTVTPDQRQDVIGLLEENEHVCVDANEGTICRQSQTFDEEGSVWTLAEEHFFRDGLWVSTWWAGTSGGIEETTSGLYDTIWG